MRGKKLAPETVERIKLAYAESGSYAEAARQCGVPESTAKKYGRGSDEFDDLRREKRVGILEELARVRDLYLAHLADPDVLAATPAKDAAVILGILTDKHQLLSGQPTERHEHHDSPAQRVTGRVAELLARRAAQPMAS